jgi:hypothetical protein
MFKRCKSLIPVALVSGGMISGIAGCASAPSTGSAMPVAAPFFNEAASGGKLFVSNFYASEIMIYPAHAQNPAPVGTITNGISNSYNLAVDRSGTLYVQNNNNTVTEYPKGATSPSKTLTEPKVGYGTGICVTVGDDGTVYAADHLAGQVYEFKNGGTTPTITLDVSEALGLALDSKNNLYVGWSNSSSGAAGHVMKFKSGSTTGHDLGITVKYSGGIAVDKHDNLLVGDQGNNVIDIFKRGSSVPFRTIDTSPAYPYQFAFDRSERYLYLVSGTPAEVYVYDYETGSLAWTDTQGLSPSGYAEGVALSPEAPQ